MDGKKRISRHSAELAPPHPRTALGLSEDRKRLIVVVVDGRQAGYSLGVSVTELRDILWETGARSWALSLNGGGSSTLWFNGKVMNRPCYGERPVINSLSFRLYSRPDFSGSAFLADPEKLVGYFIVIVVKKAVYKSKTIDHSLKNHFFRRTVFPHPV